jgi:Transcriptional Coactivator p15 (PC4)
MAAAPIVHSDIGCAAATVQKSENREGRDMVHKRHKPIIVAEWRRNQSERIRITLEVFKGRNVIDLRTWWTDHAGKEHAGRHGITVDISHTPRLAAGFKKARRIAKKHGLLGDE